MVLRRSFDRASSRKVTPISERVKALMSFSSLPSTSKPLGTRSAINVPTMRQEGGSQGSWIEENDDIGALFQACFHFHICKDSQHHEQPSLHVGPWRREGGDKEWRRQCLQPLKYCLDEM